MDKLVIGIDHQTDGRYVVSITTDDEESQLLYYRALPESNGYDAMLEADRLGKLMEALGHPMRYWLKAKNTEGAFFQDRWFGFPEQAEKASQ